MIKVTIRQLEYFQSLAQTLHFGRAAEFIGVSQPALSAQIAEMENKLHLRLFERDAKMVRLTAEGEALLPRAEAILSDLRDLEAAAHHGRKAMAGQIRLGIIPTAAPYVLPHLLPAMQKFFPCVKPVMAEAITATLVDMTSAGAMDCFVAAVPLAAARLTSETLFEDPFFLAVPASDPDFDDTPVPAACARLDRIMLLEDGHCLRDQALDLCGPKRTPSRNSYGATSLATLLQMVAHGFGVTVVPGIAAVAARAIEGVRVIPFADPVPSRHLCLAWRRGDPRASDYREIAALLRNLLPVLTRPSATGKTRKSALRA